MSPSGRVDCRIDGGLARVTLCHPGKFNAMSRPMWRELRRVFEELALSETVRCVLVQGHEGHFCAGGDISEYPDFRFDAAALRAFHEDDVWGGLSAMLDCDLPVVAQIAGNCMGAGLEIASCCDLRVASESARFGAPIAKLGFPMAPREAQLVAHAVGELTAREMLLAAAVLPATEMEARGFLNRVLPVDTLDTEIRTLIDGMIRLSPLAARLNKQTLRALGGRGQGVDSSAALLAGAYRYADSAEHIEGISAFLAKRPPQF